MEYFVQKIPENATLKDFVHKIPENTTLETLKALKERVQIIETLLKEYYIDTEFLELENLMYRKISQSRVKNSSYILYN